MKLGLFGGSFDPAHLGHLLVAQAAVEELGLDRLFFIPAGQSPFKLESPPSPAAVRLQLLRLALAGRTHYDTASSLIVAEGAGGSLNTTPTKFVGANAIAAVIARTGIHVVSCMDEIFRLDAIAHQWTRSARSSTPSLRSAFEIQTPLQAVRALPDSPAPRPLLRADQRQGRRVRIAPFRPTSPADAPVSIDHRALLAVQRRMDSPTRAAAAKRDSHTVLRRESRAQD